MKKTKNKNNNKLSINYQLLPTGLRKLVDAKQTIEGKNALLSSWESFHILYPDSQTVFEEIFETMRMKSNDKCKCGCSILKYWTKYEKFRYKCRVCGREVSPLALTPLRGVHKPLNQVLSLVLLMLQGKHGVTAAEVSRHFNWKYETSLNILHRIRTWMGIVTGNYKFDDAELEVDEVYPLVTTGLGRTFRKTRGMGSHRIKPVVVLTDRKTGKTKGLVVPSANTQTLKPIFKDSVSTDSSVFTDEKNIYNFLSKEGYNHSTCNHNSKDWVNMIT